MRTVPLAYPDFGKVTPCTTSTRPTGSKRYTGKVIYDETIAALLFWNGSTWVPIAQSDDSALATYVPTFSGTKGNGTTAGEWSMVNGWVSFWASMTWGSTTSASGNHSLTLPATAANVRRFTGSVVINQGGTQRRWHGGLLSTTTCSGFDSNDAAITNSTPITTWANGHFWFITGTYPAA